MPDLRGKTIIISGASRGIGRQIALKAAADGANIVIAAKTSTDHPTLEGTIHSVANEVLDAGGQALPLVMDIRQDEHIAHVISETLRVFGGIDILVNNASAINLTNTLHTSMKNFDLMFDVNVRGTFALSQACIPHLKNAANPHILNLSPPLMMKAKWFQNHCAYTMAKYGMSMCVLGMAAEFAKDGIAVNALWPRTAIATAALKMIGGDKLIPGTRRPEIVADAAYAILVREARAFTGQFFVDDEVLTQAGITDFTSYATSPGNPLIQDFFLD